MAAKQSIKFLFSWNASFPVYDLPWKKYFFPVPEASRIPVPQNAAFKKIYDLQSFYIQYNKAHSIIQ